MQMDLFTVPLLCCHFESCNVHFPHFSCSCASYSLKIFLSFFIKTISSTIISRGSFVGGATFPKFLVKAFLLATSSILTKYLSPPITLSSEFYFFPAKIPKKWLFQALKCENFSLFLVLRYNKLNIFGMWLLIGQTTTFDDVITYCDGHFSNVL